METTNQQVPEQQPQAQQEERKKGVSPFLKGVLTTIAAGTTIYLGYRYRHELKRGAKKISRKVSGLFSSKKEEELSMIIIEAPRNEERRREHRPNPNSNPHPQQNNWKGGQNSNLNNVKR